MRDSDAFAIGRFSGHKHYETVTEPEPEVADALNVMDEAPMVQPVVRRRAGWPKGRPRK